MVKATTRGAAETAALAVLEQAVTDATTAWVGLDWDADDTDIEHLATALESRAKRGDPLSAARPGQGEPITSWYQANGSYRAQQHSAALLALSRRLDAGVTVEDLAEVASWARCLADEAAASVESHAASAAEQGALAVEAARAGNLGAARESLENACRLERKYGDVPTWGTVLRALVRLEALAAAEEEATDDAQGVALAACIRESLERSPQGWDALRAGSAAVLSDWAQQEGLEWHAGRAGVGYLSAGEVEVLMAVEEILRLSSDEPVAVNTGSSSPSPEATA